MRRAAILICAIVLLTVVSLPACSPREETKAPGFVKTGKNTGYLDLAKLTPQDGQVILRDNLYNKQKTCTKEQFAQICELFQNAELSLFPLPTPTPAQGCKWVLLYKSPSDESKRWSVNLGGQPGIGFAVRDSCYDFDATDSVKGTLSTGFQEIFDQQEGDAP